MVFGQAGCAVTNLPHPPAFHKARFREYGMTCRQIHFGLHLKKSEAKTLRFYI